jgi:myo-inositol-1(or 4)-monophosphatase
VAQLVAAAFPGHGFVGEEADAGAGQPPPGASGHSGAGTRWIVDPLDGTTNYVHGFPAFCVSVAVADGDDILAGAIYDPLRDECFTARRGAGAWLDGRPIRTPVVTDDIARANACPPPGTL